MSGAGRLMFLKLSERIHRSWGDANYGYIFPSGMMMIVKGDYNEI